MATHYTFMLDNGSQLHAGPDSLVRHSDGTMRAPAEITIGDRVVPVFGTSALVVNILAQES